jgi:hypothetical protein
MRSPRRRRLLSCALLGLVVGLAAWFFGVDVAHALGLGAVTAALALCVALVGDQPRVDWEPAPVQPRDGSRRDVVQLGWALHSRGGAVAPEAVRRLRSVTEQALDLHGLSLDDPAHRPEVERVLGPEVLRIIRRGSAERPRLTTYEAALRVLDRLADAPPGPLPDAPPPATSAPPRRVADRLRARSTARPTKESTDVP